MIVDCAVYDDGRRRPGEIGIDDAIAAAREPGTFVWIGLHEPGAEEFELVRAAFDLHPLAVEDAVHAHQRPKLEVYDGDLFVVLKPIRYDDASEALEISELQVFVGDCYAVTVRHGAPGSLGAVRSRLDADPDHGRHGPMSVLHAVLDHVIDGYAPVIEGLDHDLVELEATVFDSNRPRGVDPTARMYHLKRSVLDFVRNTEGLVEPLGQLADGDVPGVPHDLHSYFRDVEDHLTRVMTGIHQLRELLNDAFDAHLAQVTMRQNDDMRAISAWAGIALVPTVVGAIYGMNFRHMPELDWRFGYPLVALVTAAICVALWARFKRIGWL